MLSLFLIMAADTICWAGKQVFSENIILYSSAISPSSSTQYFQNTQTSVQPMCIKMSVLYNICNLFVNIFIMNAERVFIK